jgi:putative DNA methylase
MPNHVHALIVAQYTHPLSRIVHSWKSYSANRINRLLSRSGRLWRREYYDHFVRDNDEYGSVVGYIENNPVAAALAATAADWRWSSAWSGRGTEGGQF